MTGVGKELDVQTKGIPWLRVFAEGAVIVGSILLAFALDAWWGDRSRRAELREQASVVADEMESAHQALRAVLDVHEWNARLVEQLTADLTRVAEGGVVVLSDSLIGPLLPQATADVTTGSLEAFIAAGGLELVEDPEVRRDMLAWPTRIEDLKDDEIYLRNFAAADLASYLRANYAVANAERLSTALVRSAFGAAPPVDPERVGTLTLRHEPRLLNLLAAREAGERGLRSGLVDMLDQAARIVASLEEVN